MTKRTRKIVGMILLVAFMVLIMGAMVFAQTDFEAKVEKVKNNISTAATVLIAFSAVFCAVTFMASAVNPKLKDRAKEALIALVIGIIIWALAGSIASMVSGLIQ